MSSGTKKNYKPVIKIVELKVKMALWIQIRNLIKRLKHCFNEAVLASFRCQIVDILDVFALIPQRPYHILWMGFEPRTFGCHQLVQHLEH